MRNKIGRRGFTLLEVVIYAGLLAVFFAASLAFVMSIFDSWDNNIQKNELLAAQEFVERKLNWAISGAGQIELPSQNATSSVLKILMNDASSTRAEFFTASGTLYLSLSSGTPVPLTNGRMNMLDFSVSHIASTSSPPQLLVNFFLKSPSGRQFGAVSQIFHVLKR